MVIYMCYGRTFLKQVEEICICQLGIFSVEPDCPISNKHDPRVLSDRINNQRGPRLTAQQGKPFISHNITQI